MGYGAFVFTKPGQFPFALARLPAKSALNFFRMSGFRFRYSFPSRTCQVLMSTGKSLSSATPKAQKPPNCGAYLAGSAAKSFLCSSLVKK